MSVRITYQGRPILEKVIKGKRKLASVVSDEYAPNKFIMEVIGKEIIAGFQGADGMYMEDVYFTKAGKPIGKKGKQYPYGIRREKSPDGTPYAPLSEVTKKIKRKNESAYTNKILQDRGGTDPDSLINSLRYRVTYNDRKTTGVSGGVVVEMFQNNDASVRLEEGGDRMIETGNFKAGETQIRKAYVPPRPHREVQDMVRKQIQSLLLKWAKRNDGNKV